MPLGVANTTTFNSRLRSNELFAEVGEMPVSSVQILSFFMMMFFFAFLAAAWGVIRPYHDIRRRWFAVAAGVLF